DALLICYIHKCLFKLYCAKRKPYVNHVQKRCRLLWARRNLGWTITQWKRVLWSDESVFPVFVGRNGRCVLQTRVVSVPVSHVCDGNINSEKYIEILEQH